MSKLDVLIVGAGLAGLSCARRLQTAGVAWQIVEAADGVGGRVRTDRVEGFLLDRGFQVLLTAYPEARRVLDYDKLELRPFYPGAQVHLAGQFYRMADPWRHLLDGWRGFSSPIGNWRDKLLVGRLRRHARKGSLAELFQRPETTTHEYLRATGFSDRMISRFFQPFLGGIFLEPELRTSSRMLEFVFRMLSLGDNAVPAAGMGAIPAQLAAALPAESIRLRTTANSVRDQTVTLESGERLTAPVIVLATEEPARARLLGENTVSASRGVACLYFATDDPPATEPILFLDGNRDGLVNNLCVLSAVAPSYAPRGKHLISVTVLGDPVDGLETGVRHHLGKWFGQEVADWRHLRTYRIRHAQPDAVQLHHPATPPAAQVRPGLFLCGDYREGVSIHHALLSGRRAAEAILGA